VFRYIKEPLKIYDLECILTVHVLIDEFKPLNIKIFNDVFVKLIKGPYFLAARWKQKAGMVFDKLIEYLEKNGYSKS
jgi:hypothetical protein